MAPLGKHATNTKPGAHRNTSRRAHNRCNRGLEFLRIVVVPWNWRKREEYNGLVVRSCVVPYRPGRDTCRDTRAVDALISETTRRFRRDFDAEGWPSGRWRWS